jgi:hypothetical protein
MSLSAFVALCLGMAVETLTLWEGPRPPRRGPAGTPVVGPARLAIAVLFVVALALVGLFELTGLAAHEVYMGQGVIDSIFVGLGLFLIYFGLVDPRLLPRIDEAAALGVHTTVVLGVAMNTTPAGPAWPYALMLTPPTLGLLYAALTRRPLGTVAQAMVYLWYLGCLFALALQQDFSALAEPVSVPLPLTEAFVIGASGVFLLLHSLFLLRFCLMMSALILPRNRPYIGLAMPHLFDDRQAPRWHALAFPALAVGVLLLNAQLDLAPNLAVVNALVLLLVQARPTSK